MHILKIFSQKKFSNFLALARRILRLGFYLYAIVVSAFFCLALSQTQVQAQVQPKTAQIPQNQPQSQIQTQPQTQIQNQTPNQQIQQRTESQTQPSAVSPSLLQQPSLQQKPSVRSPQPSQSKQSPTSVQLQSPVQPQAPVQSQTSVNMQNQVITVDPQNISAAIQKTEEAIASAIASKRMAGVAIAVVYRNQVIYMQGFGVRKLGAPDKVDVDTIFQLGSVSKPIAATLAAVLTTKGYFHLTDPVIQYLPDFTLNSKQPRNALRILNVLDHTSGLTRGGFNNMIESFATHDELVANLQTVRVASPVGKKYDYHNAMFSLIADIVQATTHQQFPTALANFLLRPLNMTRTSATYDGLMSTENRANPHTNSKGGLYAVPEYSQGYYAVAPAGGINSSVRDMSNFLKAQMGGYPQIVNRQALTELQTPYTSTNNLLAGVPGAAQRIKNPRYGLGWRIVDYMDQPLIFHGGWLKGFTNFIGFLPDQQLGIVILHNSDTKFSAKTAMKFFEVALGLPEVANVPKASKGKGSKGSKTNKAKASKGKSGAKAGKSSKGKSKKSGKAAKAGKSGTKAAAKGTKSAKSLAAKSTKAKSSTKAKNKNK